YTLVAEIEIIAPPAMVREKFLQFNQLLKYHPNSFFKSISTIIPNTPLEVSTKLHVIIEISSIDPPMIGGRGLLGTFNSNHAFYFTESQVIKGVTTFIQEEKFNRLLTYIVSEGIIMNMIGIREKTKNSFKGFNQDFKKWVNSRK
ncbi:hypothetical protein OIDMADRAFT_111184, partial [Oidiodendron maius Zn]